jgi:hypothetical protein
MSTRSRGTRFASDTHDQRTRIKNRRPEPQAIARSSRRNRSAPPSGISFSISSWVLCQTGKARASNRRPLSVSINIRLRRSAGSGEIFTSPRCSSGFKAAVSVVRSIESNDATGRIDGGSGRLSDINSENCPFVSSNGRKASSNLRASARAARCT